jgi:nucleoside-diphosphate-sugar epimerase
MLKPKNKILLVGGGGYLGRAVIKCLSSKELKNVVVYGRSKCKIPGVEEIVGDVDNLNVLSGVIKNSKTVVYLVTENKSGNPKDHQKANVGGLKNCLELSKKYGVEKLIYISTTMVFKKDSKLVDETNYEYRQKPSGNLYVDSKTEGVKLLNNFDGLNKIIVYPSVVVNQSFLYKQPVGVIESIKCRIGLLTQGGVMLRAGDSNRRISYVFIDQVANLIAQLIRSDDCETEYLAVSVNTTPKDQIRNSQGKINYFPISISDWIFKKVFGELQYDLIHQENHYSNKRMKKMLVSSNNS